MTDSEYLSQRKELENRIAQLDAAHLNDREYNIWTAIMSIST